MATAGNPLIGSGWGGSGAPPSLFAPSPIGFGQPTPGTGASGVGSGPWGNPGGYPDPLGKSALIGNPVIENTIGGQLKNLLVPQFAQQFGQYGGTAGNLFGMLAQRGSPFYQQKQQQAFNQGVQQNQNAAATARQEIGAAGYGSTPSGATAATIGGMESQGAQNLVSNYLQQLFQNENLMLQGGGDLMSLAQLFNPSQMLTAGPTSQVNPQSNFFQNFLNMAQGIGNLIPG